MHDDRSDAEVLINSADEQAGLNLDEQGLGGIVFSSHELTRIGLMWDASPDTVLEARFADADLNWSGWLPIRATWADEETHEARVGAVEADIAAPHHFQIRLVDGPAPTYLMAENVEPEGEGTELVEVGADDGLQSVVAKAEFGLTVSGLSIIRRSQWGAHSARCSYGSHRPNKITVHHTDTPNRDSISARSRVRQIQSYHKNSRRFCDIGYHFLIDRAGNVYEGTLDNKRGAHVRKNNDRNLGISFIGSFNGSNRPTSAMLSSASKLMRGIRSRWGVTLNRTYVRGHRQYRGNNRRDCPGDRVYEKLSTMISGASGGGGDDGGGGGGDTGVDGQPVGSCTVGTARGSCFDVNGASCTSGYKSGYCLGGSNIKCCLDNATSTAYGHGKSCTIGSKSGTCLDTSFSSCSTGFKSGYCPGSSKIKCCLN